MKISEIIDELQQVQKRHGDIPACIELYGTMGLSTHEVGKLTVENRFITTEQGTYENGKSVRFII